MVTPQWVWIIIPIICIFNLKLLIWILMKICLKKCQYRKWTAVMFGHSHWITEMIVDCLLKTSCYVGIPNAWLNSDCDKTLKLEAWLSSWILLMIINNIVVKLALHFFFSIFGLVSSSFVFNERSDRVCFCTPTMYWHWLYFWSHWLFVIMVVLISLM